jgi:dTDP-4-dehydrorhamnose 3,5-epimerase
MKVWPTHIDEVVVVESLLFTDHRGTFSRLFCQRELASILGQRSIVQVNHSCTLTVGAIRGMHYQYPPHAEMKLVRCLKGRVWDVAVDLRRGSSTFLRWHAEELTADNRRMLVVPEGCAHGFQVLDAGSELLYLHTNYYAPPAEIGVRFDDARISIAWPLPPTDLSDRDRWHPALPEDFGGLAV